MIVKSHTRSTFHSISIDDCLDEDSQETARVVKGSCHSCVSLSSEGEDLWEKGIRMNKKRLVISLPTLILLSIMLVGFLGYSVLHQPAKARADGPSTITISNQNVADDDTMTEQACARDAAANPISGQAIAYNSFGHSGDGNTIALQSGNVTTDDSGCATLTAIKPGDYMTLSDNGYTGGVMTHADAGSVGSADSCFIPERLQGLVTSC